ncbi:MAG: NAD-dependent epimerase [Gammaproteobacteria bacterium]|nr:NAD-dependent epimerase [Gammaproteobacteria bacterium]
MQLLITGCAGFIGYHLAQARLKQGDEVIGIDNLNDYYDVNLKKSRLDQLTSHPNFKFHQTDICDRETINDLFSTHRPQQVVNLAAQPGVRYSLENPHAYVQSNIVGFTNLIEACRLNNVEHFVYASTSSVYGANRSPIHKESDATNHPLSIYAAIKKANELVAHSYSHLYQLPTTGLRFFTVYGPWGRPDMAFFSFTRDILAGRPIKIYNHGQMQRDFTYIDDITAGLSKVMDKPAVANSAWSFEHPDAASGPVPYRVYNMGSGNPMNLMSYIQEIELALGKEAIKQFEPMQNGDMLSTHACTKRFQTAFDYVPQVTVKEGVGRFVKWYMDFYS